ncbi:MAG: hypothetical protein ACRD50_13450 [Candidatus Acidiferrales bacterium]
MKLTRNLKIEDPRNHPAETVAKLRELLEAGARVHPDPKRANFFELEHGPDVFYIHVSPVNGNVVLLATWKRSIHAPRPAEAQHQAA